MTMKFRTVKAALIAILGAAEGTGKYKTIGFQRQEKAAEEFLGDNRLVEAFFINSNFEERKGRRNGPINNDVTIAIQLTVSAPAKVDLAVINDPGSTALEVQTAMAALKEASNIVDDSIDELYDNVFQIIMDAENLTLGLAKGVVANRWISSMNKNDVNPRGELVVITGIMDFTCSVSEEILGIAGIAPNPLIDSQLEINQDTVQKTGLVVQ